MKIKFKSGDQFEIHSKYEMSWFTSDTLRIDNTNCFFVTPQDAQKAYNEICKAFEDDLNNVSLGYEILQF